jgi:poly(3-hydroxybutyrate) depolymerase
MATRSSIYYLVAAVCFFHSFDVASAASEGRRSNGCTHVTSVPYHKSAGTSELSIDSPAGGGERQFRLFIHPSYVVSEPAPLILAFHGKAQNASAMEFQTQFSSPGFNNNTIIAYPQGINKQWSGDPEAPLTSEINDIEFANDLLDYIEQEYCIDTSRVYATGFSNGGGLTDLLACDTEVSTRMAAAAIASGAFYKDSALKEPLFSHCTPSHVLPIMEFHGSKDPVEHYDGKTTPDGESYALPEWAEEWAIRNGCNIGEENKTVKLFNGNVEKSMWSCGENEDVVIHYYIHGFGHGWPSTVPLENDYQRYGPTYFNATPVIMDFFRKHVLSSGNENVRMKDEL